MRNVDAMIAECMPLILEHGLNINEVREVIETDKLGEQMLPVNTDHQAAVMAARD